MAALHELVQAGKFDTPAWKGTQGHRVAQFRGWSPFIALQIEDSPEQTATLDELTKPTLDFPAAP